MVASTSISRTRRRFGVTTSVVAAAAVAAAVLLVVATGSAVVNAPAKHTQISLWNTNIPIGVDAFVSTPPSTWTARAQQRDQIVSWQQRRHNLQARLQVVKEDIQSSTSSLASSTSTSTTSASSFWLTLALQSPLWKYVLVPLARQKIIDTAEQNGIPWTRCKAWLLAQDGPWNVMNVTDGIDTDLSLLSLPLPSWYTDVSYHAYDTGHLSWEAAVEIELASAAIGARNIPMSQRHGEAVFRQAFWSALQQAGAITAMTSNNDMIRVVDVGCATGTSTRFLATQCFPQPTRTEAGQASAADTMQSVSICGVDLSPYYIATARRLQELATATTIEIDGNDDDNHWVCPIPNDDRIRYEWANFGENKAVTTASSSQHSWNKPNSVDVVNLQFVLHEVPLHVALDMIKHAHAILKPNTGQLWLCEMDFQSPAYAAQRSNPLLYSLLRATEPYLDDYANGQEAIWRKLRQLFGSVTVVPATGRHYSCVAVKSGDSRSDNERVWKDERFDATTGQYRVDDTHLKLWENKKA